MAWRSRVQKRGWFAYWLSADAGNPIDAVWEPYITNPKHDFHIEYNDVSFPAGAIGPGIPAPTLRGWHVPAATKPTSYLSWFVLPC